MKYLLGIGLVLMVAVFFGCSGQATCARGDWCDCNGGTDCYQGCAGDGNGCRLFCHDLIRCGNVCGNDCNLACYNATDCTADCGDNCNFVCNDSTSCGASCGENCNYTCYNMQNCAVRARAGSQLTCSNAKSCVFECLGDCTVYCMDQVDFCQVSCPNGVSPVSCADGRLVCGSC